MGYQVSFKDTAEVTATELNAICTEFGVTSQSITFANGTSYSVEDLNNIRADVFNAGFVKRPKFYATGTSSLDRTITISDGSWIFANGLKMAVDSTGVSVPSGQLPSTSTTFYIYAFCTDNYNCGFYATTTQSTNTNTILVFSGRPYFLQTNTYVNSQDSGNMATIKQAVPNTVPVAQNVNVTLKGCTQVLITPTNSSYRFIKISYAASSTSNSVIYYDKLTNKYTYNSDVEYTAPISSWNGYSLSITEVNGQIRIYWNNAVNSTQYSLSVTIY